MYNPFKRSTMDYASVVWGGYYKLDFLVLEKILVDAMRLITGALTLSNRLNLHQEIPLQAIKPFSDHDVQNLMWALSNYLKISYWWYWNTICLTGDTKKTVNLTFWLNEGKINFVYSCCIISILLLTEYFHT